MPAPTVGLFFILFWILLPLALSSTNYTVGGESGWDESSDLLGWVSSISDSFYVGDTLVFRYGPSYDVREVDAEAFLACFCVHPISMFHDGFTIIPLRRPGVHFFICGRAEHCIHGVRLSVVVESPPSPWTTTPHPLLVRTPHSPFTQTPPSLLTPTLTDRSMRTSIVILGLILVCCIALGCVIYSLRCSREEGVQMRMRRIRSWFSCGRRSWFSCGRWISSEEILRHRTDIPSVASESCPLTDIPRITFRTPASATTVPVPVPLPLPHFVPPTPPTSPSLWRRYTS